MAFALTSQLNHRSTISCSDIVVVYFVYVRLHSSITCCGAVYNLYLVLLLYTLYYYLFTQLYHINTQNTEYKNNKAYRIRNAFKHMGQNQLFKHDVQAEILGNPEPSSIPNALLHLVREHLRQRFVALRIAIDSRALIHPNTSLFDFSHL